MIQVKKEVYIGYVVARFLGGEPEILPTECMRKSKIEALHEVCIKEKILKTNVACEMISSGVKKVTIKWQRKSLKH